MRVYAMAAVLLAVLATGKPVVLSALAPRTSTIRALSPGSTPTSIHPTPTLVPPQSHDGLELRQVQGFEPVAAPPPEVVAPAVAAAAPPAPVNPPAAVSPAAVPPATDPLLALAPVPAAPAAAMPPANQPVPPAPPAAVPVPPLPATTTIPIPPLVTGDDFVTVQWVETHIGTLRTWVAKTETFHFEAMSQAPLPGVGSIGMGTLTGKTGQTQTIFMVVGAAPTPAIELKKGIAAAVAVGFAGLLV